MKTFFRFFEPIGKARRALQAQRIGREAAARLGGMAQRWGRGKAGIAAVEFALILPMMLVLYFGCAVLAQGLEAGRKTQVLSTTLADLTARTLAGTYSDCSSATPCVTDTDLAGIFGAATAVLNPFNGVTQMTISEIIFDNQTGTTKCCDAKLVWSAASGTGASPRTCQTFASTGSGPTTIPAGLYPAASANNSTDSFLIVADVTYAYAPSFGFTPFNWGPAGNGSGYNITVTAYATPRGSANQSIQWTPGGAITNKTCSYNVP